MKRTILSVAALTALFCWLAVQPVRPLPDVSSCDAVEWRRDMCNRPFPCAPPRYCCPDGFCKLICETGPIGPKPRPI